MVARGGSVGRTAVSASPDAPHPTQRGPADIIIGGPSRSSGTTAVAAVAFGLALDRLPIALDPETTVGPRDLAELLHPQDLRLRVVTDG